MNWPFSILPPRVSKTPWGATSNRLSACPEDMDDPTSGNAALHDCHAPLIIALDTVLCGGQGAGDIAPFANAKEIFFRELPDR